MVLPLIAGAAGAAWVGNAIFGGDDMSQVNKFLPIYLAVQEGSPRPLQEASTLAGSHSKGQEKFAGDADRLAKLLGEAWEGDAAEAATKKVTKLAKAARETGTALNTNSQNFNSQAGSFDELKSQMKHMDDPAPGGSGFLDRLNPLDTGAEKAVEKNQEAAKHNIALYDQYGKTTASNAESITDKYGHAGDPGKGGGTGDPGDPPGNPGDPGGRKKAEEEARRRQEEARRKAEEQRRKMAEEARKRQEEAQRKAEEQRRKMEEEARRRQQEAEKRAEEQRRKMEEEAGRRQQEAEKRAEEQRRRMEEEARRRQQEAEERARQAREAMRRSGSSFTPGSTSASSFSPSDFAGAGGGAGGGTGGFGAAGAGTGAGASDGAAAGAGRASGAMAPGSGAAGGGAGAGARGGAGGGRMGGMGGMMGGAGGGGKGGDDKEHKRKVMATENPDDLFGTDEKAVPPVIGDK